MKTRFHKLKDEACQEAYEYFDQNVRKLPRDSNGNFDELSNEFGDNDVDAFRHAYVSGVFTQEYGESVANILGILNEIPTYAYNSPNTANSRNMDLWNNAVGRRYGKKTRKRETLAKALLHAMKKGEMILNLKDKRKFTGNSDFQGDSTKPVIVLEESKTGRNELFYDTNNQKAMSRSEFVRLIKEGSYPGYRVVNLYGKATPISVPDGDPGNNLS